MPDIADETIALYQRLATTWDKRRDRTLVERGWLDRFLALVPPAGAVLDLGCGAGEPIARYLIEAGCRVTGVDASANMLALCRARWPDGDWRLADMRTLALGTTFDGILAWNSFFHLPREEQRRIFPLFAGHARPGAALMFTSGPHDCVGHGLYRGEIMHLASLDPQEYRQLLADNGFAVVDHVAQDPTCEDHTIWLAQKTLPQPRSTP